MEMNRSILQGYDFPDNSISSSPRICIWYGIAYLTQRETGRDSWLASYTGQMLFLPPTTAQKYTVNIMTAQHTVKIINM